MPRYEKLGYVALNVSDIDRAAAFYERQLGLCRNGEGEAGEVFFRCGPEHHSLILYPAAAPGLKRIGFALENERAVGELARHLAAQGIEAIEVDAADCAVLRQGRTIRITEPWSGATLEFYGVMQQSAVPVTLSLAKIQRIGHVVLKLPEIARAAEFYTTILGLRISDVIEGAAIFMRCHPAPYHHGIALIKGPAPLLHHVNFMVSEIDDIGRAIARFTRDRVTIVNGPGRHPPSDSIFLYFLDPDGMTLEYSFGMEEFPESDPREPRHFEPVRRSFDYWESFLDSRKASIGAIERQRPALS